MKRARPGKQRKHKPAYPLVVCDGHGGDPLPGYVVCVHAIANPQIALGPIEHSTKERVGVVVCVTCAAHQDLPVEKIQTACAHYVQEKFGVPL